MSVEDELKRQNAMDIEGRFFDERERLKGNFTKADREYRRAYLKDMELAHDEPKIVYELENSVRNPIRKMFGLPWDMLSQVLKPAVGAEWAAALRYHLPKYAMGISLLFGAWYYVKYNTNDWTRLGGWRIRQIRPSVRAGNPEFPKPSARKEPSDYHDRGFKDRKVFLD